MNYQIIKNRETLLEFIKWLPELQENECFYVALFARSKYAKNEDGSNKFSHIKTDKAQLKRFTVQNKKWLYDKIKQLEVEIGAYKTKDGDDIPQEALALYISVNPRSHKKGMLKCMKRFCDIIECNGTNFNIHQEALSAIQKSSSRKIYFDMDFDYINPWELSSTIGNFINEDSLFYLKTRGGFHLLVELSNIDEQYKKSWYQDIVREFKPDIKGDNLIPVPGCTQGNFIPHFI